ncbi:MAG: aminopeptidase P family protein [Gammaproteobacteria bacterium]|nr:aminopeptidase P family protein [Gammaproteobacteria bacterium]
MMDIEQRLQAVRQLMVQEGIDALVVPRADEHLGEYLPAHNERLLWVSGFTGSAGAAVILRERAAIFVDGRYTVQVRKQVDAQLFEYCDLLQQPPLQWLLQQLPAGSRVACDPRLHSLLWYRDTVAALAAAQMQLYVTQDNVIDRCWAQRPQAVVAPALLLDQAFTGESSAGKRGRMAAEVAAAGCDAALVFAPDSVSWLLNIRGRDIPRLPVVQSFALLLADASLILFIHPARIPPGFNQHVGEDVRVVPADEADTILATMTGKRILTDPDAANAWTQLALEQAGATLVTGEDPVLLAKACKNPVELAGTRRAHLRDAVAEIQFLAWLDAQVAAGQLHDEAVLADKLLALRSQQEHFQDLSFDTISAAGANAAMCHYNHLNGQPADLVMDSVYLVDSGGQYLDGTTDITRTVAIGNPGDEVRRMFTLVLKGHIALDQARFPPGTTGTQLDALARQFLWREGYDFDHGTGHGVGVFLSVHEGPQRISKNPSRVALRPGMIVSDEPGYYRDKAYGIRCENLVVVTEVQNPGAERPMLGFEALTLVPFDYRLIDASLLSGPELQWLNDYHQHVLETVGPLLGATDRDWLVQATRHIGP